MGNPEISECGKAIKFLRDAHDVDHLVSAISASYLVQTYVDLPVEYGVFYVRHADTSRIVGINGKSFPTVTGDGQRTVQALIEAHDRYTFHWNNFVHGFDMQRVLNDGERLRLSHIGSHTMGCVFTDETPLATPQMAKRLFSILESVGGAI